MELLPWTDSFLLLGLVSWLSALVNLAMNLRYVHTLLAEDATLSSESSPLVSVLVPARNEERSVEAAVRSFCEQDYPNLEVIVVDDRSTDGTSEILGRLESEHDNLAIIEGDDPPDGWLGKAWALHKAQARASGEWLALIDADVILERSMIGASVSRASSESIDVMSGIVDYIRVGFWEELLMTYFRNLMLTITRLARLLPERLRSKMAVGSFILIRREAYDAIGGHSAIRYVLPNDVAIAKAAARAGRSHEFLFLDRLVHWRMYQGFREIWNGFVKNWFPLMGGNLAGSLLHVMFVFTQIAPWIAATAVAYSSARGAAIDPRTITLLVLTFGTFLTLALLLRSRFSSPLWTSPLYPLSVTVFFLIALRSTWSHVVKKRVVWRGRSLSR